MNTNQQKNLLEKVFGAGKSPAEIAEIVYQNRNNPKELNRLAPHLWTSLATQDVEAAKIFFSLPQISRYLTAKDLAEIIDVHREEQDFVSLLPAFLSSSSIDVKAIAKARYHTAVLIFENEKLLNCLTKKEQAELVCQFREHHWFMSELPEQFIKNLARQDASAALMLLKAGITEHGFNATDKVKIIRHHSNDSMFVQQITALITDSHFDLAALIAVEPSLLEILSNSERKFPTTFWQTANEAILREAKHFIFFAKKLSGLIDSTEESNGNLAKVYVENNNP